MSKRTKYTAEGKLKILEEYEKGYVSIADLGRDYGIDRVTFYDWKKRYEKYGL